MKSLRLAALTVLFASPGAAALGCSYSGIVSPAPPEHPTPVAEAQDASPAVASDGGGIAPDVQVVIEAGSTLPAMLEQGSPLCNASLSTGCYPDKPTPAQACPPDGGTADLAAVMPDASLACRVVTDSDGYSAHPSCFAAGQTTVGQACAMSSDCAAGLDCIAQGATTGVCAPYCCQGNTACGAYDFCDVQSLADMTSTKVPVCIPMIHCDLFSTDCSTGQTCAIVRVDPLTGMGTTSCVDVGTAPEGQSCDREHCAKGLDCLGNPGARQCFKLCHVGGSDCLASQVCAGGLPLFSANAGICVSASASP
jgi:hypothetical protein